MVERGLSASECPVCYDRLGPQRVPYSLTCGHTVCWICVKRLGEGVKSFSCPLCREHVPTSAVKRNVTLLQLITQLSQSSTTPFSRSLSTPFESIELGRLLDRGASGEVYHGVWQSNDVAIKVFSSGQLSSDAHESFHREVCIMNTLRHPNVVLLLAASPSLPKLAIIMEYVGGGSLYSHLYIEKTSLSIETMAHLLADVTRGLQYLHSINILHRDLKSKNVLLTTPPPLGRAKLCDFGLARMRLESATMTGNIGTVHWTAPEVLNCGRYHFSADIYSFGMVVYEMISRAIPFSNLPPPAVIVAVLIRRDRPVAPADTHPIFLSLFNQCTSWEAAKRPSILSIIRDLTPLITSSSSPTTLTDKKESDFDYTDSLGHVTIDLELGDEEDEELLQFLQAQLSEEEGIDQLSLSNEGLTPHQQQLQQVSSINNDVTNQQDVYEDTRGVLSLQELDDYHNMSSESNSSSNDHSNSSHRASYFNVPNLVPANSLRPPNASLNSAPSLVTQDTITSASGASLQNEMQDFMLDNDRALALHLQLEEHKNLATKDYVFASEMQERERFGYRGPAPPPPPPPPLPVRIQKLPLADKKRMVLSQVRRSGHQKRNLKHVVPVEKKAFRVGRVIDDVKETTKEKVFTLQDEIAGFTKDLLFKVSFQEPKPSFPIGKVVTNRGRVHKMIHRLNSMTQSEIQNFDKGQVLRHVLTDEKILLPTPEDISAEKELLTPTAPPPPPPPPPSQPNNSLPSKKVKTRILSSGYAKKGASTLMYDDIPQKTATKSVVMKYDISTKSHEKGISSSKHMSHTKGYSKQYNDSEEDLEDLMVEKERYLKSVDSWQQQKGKVSEHVTSKGHTSKMPLIETKLKRATSPQKTTEKELSKQLSKKAVDEEMSSKKVKKSVVSKLIKITSPKKDAKTDDDFVVVEDSPSLSLKPPSHEPLDHEPHKVTAKKGKKKK